jgi:hypothetical protein
VIDAGRREEAPGANKSPARGQPGRKSPLTPGARNKWPPRPPRGSRGRAGAAGGGGRAGDPGGPRGWARIAGSSGRADGDPAAAAGRRASGRPRGAGCGLRCSRWPRARILGAAAAAALGPARHSRGARRGPTAPTLQRAGAAPGRDRPRSLGECSARGPARRAFHWPDAQEVAPAMQCPGRRRV